MRSLRDQFDEFIKIIGKKSLSQKIEPGEYAEAIFPYRGISNLDGLIVSCIVEEDDGFNVWGWWEDSYGHIRANSMNKKWIITHSKK